MRTLFIAMLVLASAAWAAPSMVEQIADGIYVVRDDCGQWSGHMSKAITHQNSPKYRAKKILDASRVPKDVWRQVKEVRVSAFFCVRDYSWHSLAKPNGLDEAYQVIVNGHANVFPTSGGAPCFKERHRPDFFAWYDIPLPKKQLVRGVNEIIISKAPGDKPKKQYDDYLYLGIDTAARPANSWVDLGDGKWRQDKLTVPGGKGEYMVRLYLITKPLDFEVAWEPAKGLTDPMKLVGYCGSRRGQTTAQGLTLAPGQSARVEWDEAMIDALRPLTAHVAGEGDFDFAWLDDKGQPIKPAARTAPCDVALPAGRKVKPSGLMLRAKAKPFRLSKLTVRGNLIPRPRREPVNIAPAIARPAGAPADRTPRCRIARKEIALENASLRCRFTTAGGRLVLASLFNEWTGTEMARRPKQIALFLVEVDGKRYAGSRDFKLDKVEPAANGFVATLSLAEPALRATLRASMEAEGLRLGLALANAGDKAVDFKLAFPHVAGLAASDWPADDYYFFPRGGGIFSNRPAVIHRGYGAYEALYQVMDVFSPARGGGLYVRADDAEGWQKGMALRKHIPGQPEVDATKRRCRTREEFKWADPLDAVEGVSFTYDYLRRTRKPGGSFAPADAVLAAHAGGWKAAMRAYADWAHRVWKWRPYPSRLLTVHNMMAAGWGHSFLFRDGAYRTDIVRPNTDCVELMSWWEWSPVGPWGVPFDKLEQAMGPAKYKRWKSYFVKDPVTGKMMWNNQPGDYRKYNDRFGGLPAFRKAIETYKRMGALVTLYTDPFRLDGYSCETGRLHGKEWTVTQDTGKLGRNYEVWNPCHDLPQVRQWVATEMKRVMQQTGADGIRLDEYGHAGWACFNPKHNHTYAEWGVVQWNKAVAETVRMVHEAMDEVRPGLILTTEHPGYDYLMHYLDGCITYDLTVQASPLRPVEVNLQRFYFPECKAYELDHRGADRKDRKKFFNGVASFGRYLPPAFYTIYKENTDVFASRDCEALVPTLEPRLYANRFSCNGKTFVHLYNATGHTFDGPAIALDLKPEQHAFDMLACAPVELVTRGRQRAARLYLERGDVACIALLPRLLKARRGEGEIAVDVLAPNAGDALALCARNGEALLSQPVQRGANKLATSALPEGKKPVCVKLLSAGTLLDVVALAR